MLGGSRTQRDEVSKTRAIGSEVTSGGDLLVASRQDQTYRAARLDSGGDIELRSGGAIRFETASDVHTESHERSKSSFAWQSASGEGFTRETLRQSELVAQGELIIQAAEGIAIDVEEIDHRSVTRTIDAMVAANPDLAWLQEMEERGDIDWRRVKAIHDSWDYEQSGLGGGVALVVAVVAAATGQYYALAALEGATAAAAVVAAAGATAGSLAGTAAVSLINNRGDLGDTFDDTFSSDSLRSAAIAALSAGATQGITDRAWGTTTNTTTGATRNLNLSFGNGSDIARFAGQRATQATIDAGVRSAIDGGSFRDHLGDGLEDALAHVVSGVLFNAVGDHAKPGSAEKVALHALVGGTVSEAMGGDFRSGALAAGASEALVDQLVENAHATPVLSNTVAQLVGIVAAELAGGDVNDGAWIAGQVESYNRQLHSEERMLARDLAERGDGYTAEEIEQALRGMYHDGLGQSPGDNVVVDLQDLDTVDGAYFDYDGDWLATPGADGTTRYLVQLVPTDTPPELIAYIIEQTGGEDSPYRAPVYQLPAEETAPGQPRDRLTGRPLDEEGRYTVSYVVDGKIYHVPHFSCGTAECNAQGANVDYSDSGAQAWTRALDARAVSDAGRLATAGVVVASAPVGLPLSMGSTALSLYEGYLSENTAHSASKAALIAGVEKYAQARGLPAPAARRLAAAIDLTGRWDAILNKGESFVRGSGE
ncbi:DUF637 domain-containing protein [Halomonas sp. M4R5S39]|uniref:DUF637 domain-containing protein n=1 Tax=Halomonas kalidii TaxID=3043293 RepID=UPI0024A92F41|nr:DUF637 domain-containing protein [Halomonas kalidii]MDI5984188.1 DUF637 domain-containing protein [Halomonas kalidii]